MCGGRGPGCVARQSPCRRQTMLAAHCRHTMASCLGHRAWCCAFGVALRSHCCACHVLRHQQPRPGQVYLHTHRVRWGCNASSSTSHPPLHVCTMCATLPGPALAAGRRRELPGLPPLAARRAAVGRQRRHMLPVGCKGRGHSTSSAAAGAYVRAPQRQNARRWAVPGWHGSGWFDCHQRCVFLRQSYTRTPHRGAPHPDPCWPVVTCRDSYLAAHSSPSTACGGHRVPCMCSMQVAWACPRGSLA